jgi:hypothetical protein
MSKLSAKQQLDRVAKATDLGPALLLKLVLEVSPEEIVEALKGMVNATMTTKDGRTVPDYRAREAGVKLYLIYVVGMPVQRVMSTPQRLESEDQTMSRLMASPAAREAMKQALATEVETVPG